MLYNFKKRKKRKYELRKLSFKINNIMGKHKYYTKYIYIYIYKY